MKLSAVAALLCLSAASTAHAAPVLWNPADGGNGHYYEYVSTPVTWDVALGAAAASTHNGVQGHLATVTSADEQAFIAANVTTAIAWLGATDRDVEGVWRWETGPEAGSIFFGPGAPVGAFAFWYPGEPNDCCGGEDELVYGWGLGGLWNDIGTPAFPTYAVGYIVEYSSSETVPEPTALALVAIGLAGAVRRRMRRA